jgi:hypothetical protein
MQKQKIHFQSEGMNVIGNLFKPQSNSKEEIISLPAVLVAGAMTGVKEQVAGQYAERIAREGNTSIRPSTFWRKRWDAKTTWRSRLRNGGF